jgi:hypothetical protein
MADQHLPEAPTSPEKKRMKHGAQGGDPDDADVVVNVEQEEADEQIKEDFAKMLDPTLISYSDLLMKRFDNRMDAMFKKVCSKYGEAMGKAQAAEERAARSEAAAEEAKTATSELKETVEDQGKHLAELEKQFLDLAAKSRGVLSGKESSLGVSSKCPSLASSPEGRLVKMQKAYMDLVAESNTTNRFILGRKKGASPVTMDVVKSTFKSFFPGIKYFPW